jgi:hypothetical protein
MMKLILTLTALSLAAIGQAQVSIEGSEDNTFVIRIDSMTYNDASESMFLKKGSVISGFHFSADNHDEKLSADERAALMSKRMTLHLDLNEKQEGQIETINLAHHQAMQTLQEAKEGFERQSALLDEQIKHQRQLKEVLDVVQYAKFKAMHENMRETHHRGSNDEHHNMSIIAKRYEISPLQEDGPENLNRSIVFIGDDEKPLIIIDGKEAEDETSMNDIDPDRIKLVEILEGKKAVNTYGEKGKNGVILITTKK